MLTRQYVLAVAEQCAFGGTRGVAIDAQFVSTLFELLLLVRLLARHVGLRGARHATTLNALRVAVSVDQRFARHVTLGIAVGFASGRALLGSVGTSNNRLHIQLSVQEASALSVQSVLHTVCSLVAQAFLRAAYVDRTGAPYNPLYRRPQILVRNLFDLSERLLTVDAIG